MNVNTSQKMGREWLPMALTFNNNEMEYKEDGFPSNEEKFFHEIKAKLRQLLGG